MNDKPYLLDGQPASAGDLIRAAKRTDESYGIGGMFFTSEAAAILRNAGHTVEARIDEPPA